MNSLSKTNRIILSLPAILITIGIFIVSNIQNLDVNIGFDWGDKLLHGIAYCGYGVSLLLFVKINFTNFSNKKIILWVLVFGAFYGMSDEFHQYFVPGRSCDFFDWTADFTGVLLSLLFFKPISWFINLFV